MILLVVCNASDVPIADSIQFCTNSILSGMFSGPGSFEIPVLCLLVHGEPRILQVTLQSSSIFSMMYTGHV